MGLWSAKSALLWAVVMTTGGREVISSCRLGGSDRPNHCLLLVYSWGRPGAAAGSKCRLGGATAGQQGLLRPPTLTFSLRLTIQEQLTRILKECGWRHIEQQQQHNAPPQPQLVLSMADNVQQALSCHGHELRVDALPPRIFSCGSSTNLGLWKQWPSGPADLISFHPTHLGMSSFAKERQLRSLRPLNRPLWCANTSVHK